MDQIVQELFDRLGPDLQECWTERAGIIEYEAFVPRGHAEALAMVDVLHRYPWALTGIVVVQVDVEGDTTWLVTTDRDGAREVAEYCGKAARYVDLADVIEHHFSGSAVLTEWPPNAPGRT